MLSKANVGYNWITLKFCSFAAFFVLKFDKNGYVRVSQSFCKVVVHRLWSLAGVTYTVYTFIRLFQAMQKEVSEWIHTLATHLFLALTGFVGSAWSYEFSIRSPELFATVFNDISDTLYAPGVKWSGVKGLEMLLRVAPIIWAIFPATILSVYSEDPLAPHTIYSAIPEMYHTTKVLLACALVEYALQTFLMTQFYLGCVTMLTFFQMLQREYEEGMQELKSARDMVNIAAIGPHLERCRLMQLRTKLFNTLFSTSIYCLKMEAMTDVITGVFFTLRLYQSSPALASASAYVAAEDLIGFNLIFHRACDVPESIGNYKREIRRKGVKKAGTEGFRELDRFLWSVKQVGISLGGFYCFEKTSTADFCDFVFNTAISLLVSYPDPIIVRGKGQKASGGMRGPSSGGTRVKGGH